MDGSVGEVKSIGILNSEYLANPVEKKREEINLLYRPVSAKINSHQNVIKSKPWRGGSHDLPCRAGQNNRVPQRPGLEEKET